MLLQEAFQLFLNAKRGEVGEETLKWYRRRLKPLLTQFGCRDIEMITTDDLRTYRTALMAKNTRWEDHPIHPTEKGGLSPYTLHQYIRVVRTFFKWLVEEGRIASSPAVRLKLPPLPENPPKEVTEENMLKMLNYAEKHANKRDYALLCFITDTNARAAGIAGLEIGDLDLDNQQALVREKGNGGNAQGRYVYFKARTVDALQAWLKVRPDSQYRKVFTGLRGPLTTAGIYQALKRLAKAAGIKGRFNPHGFRHGWALGALRRGADLSAVSQAMGHSSIVVTAKFYARWSNSELAEQHGRFSRLPDKADENTNHQPK